MLFLDNFYFNSPHNLHQQKDYDDINLLDAGMGILKYRWPREGNKIVVPFLIDPEARYKRIQIERIYADMHSFQIV